MPVLQLYRSYCCLQEKALSQPLPHNTIQFSGCEEDDEACVDGVELVGDGCFIGDGGDVSLLGGSDLEVFDGGRVCYGMVRVFILYCGVVFSCVVYWCQVDGICAIEGLWKFVSKLDRSDQLVYFTKDGNMFVWVFFANHC